MSEDTCQKYTACCRSAADLGGTKDREGGNTLLRKHRWSRKNLMTFPRWWFIFVQLKPDTKVSSTYMWSVGPSLQTVFTIYCGADTGWHRSRVARTDWGAVKVTTDQAVAAGLYSALGSSSTPAPARRSQSNDQESCLGGFTPQAPLVTTVIPGIRCISNFGGIQSHKFNFYATHVHFTGHK